MYVHSANVTMGMIPLLCALEESFGLLNTLDVQTHLRWFLSAQSFPLTPVYPRLHRIFSESLFNIVTYQIGLLLFTALLLQ